MLRQTPLLGIYPLVNVNITMEHGHRKFVDFPIINGGSFHSDVSFHTAMLQDIHLDPAEADCRPCRYRLPTAPAKGQKNMEGQCGSVGGFDVLAMDNK